MKYPYLRPRGRKTYRIDRFLGYDRREDAPAGCFREMENGSAADAPLLRVRPRRTQVSALDGNPTGAVLTIAGEDAPVVLDMGGALWCGGHALPRLLAGSVRLSVTETQPEMQTTILDEAAVAAACPLNGDFEFVYDRDRDQWVRDDGAYRFSGGALVTEPQMDHGDRVRIRVTYLLQNNAIRSLVFLGGWVCIFPDGLYANTVRLRSGHSMRRNVDYGEIAVVNDVSDGVLVLEPCGADGALRTVTWSDTAPAGGFWVDTSEEDPTVRCWSQSEGLWRAAQSYVRCSAPGIAAGLSAGDAVSMVCRLPIGAPGAYEAEELITGSCVLPAVFHDPGGSGRAEGTNDYVVLPGLIQDRLEFEINGHYYLTLSRSLPKMDFVVSCQNRLWGCRCDGETNELYGSKLGDFRNWDVFDGLSTDSYRVSRGSGGPFTGAAVLGGCPLFFREDRLEKIYPSAGGDHGVVTVSLTGIAPGSSRSAVVIRDRLYYRARDGIFRYSGTLPVRVSDALQGEHIGRTSAGALGDAYYASIEDEQGSPHIFVLHTDTGLWQREDEQNLGQCLQLGGMLYYTQYGGGPLLCIGGAADSDGVGWSAETGPLGPTLCTKRYLSHLRLEGRLEPGSELRVYLSYDGGPWERAGSFRANRRRAELFPICPLRCGEVRLRLEGTGGMELRAISWQIEAGSDA